MNNLPRIEATYTDVDNGESREVPYSIKFDVTDLILKKNVAGLKRLVKSSADRRQLALDAGIVTPGTYAFWVDVLSPLHIFLAAHGVALKTLTASKWSYIRGDYSYKGQPPVRTHMVRLTMDMEVNLNRTILDTILGILETQGWNMYKNVGLTGCTDAEAMEPTIKANRVPGGKVYIGEEIDQL